MDYTTVIGLEVHVQLQTKTKLFCGCPNLFNPDQPNSQTCPVCLGLPGALPVMNREAFELALKVGLALNCDISDYTKWDRKQYYYPDLPKAYQISQYDLPLSHDGWVEIETDPDTGTKHRVGIIRAHLEEDAGKNLHDESGRGGESRVDLNRCGTPLVEIVTEPDLRTAADAKTLLEELRRMLTFLDVSDCNMQEGSLRCDANVNLHIHADDGHVIPTPIVEIKNLNTFRGVEAAIEFEIKRQLAEWKETGRRMGDVPKTTRGWNEQRGVTFPQRGKEEASDYRYFPDPDLVPVTVNDELVERIRGQMRELPADRRKRFREGHLLSNYDAAVIIDQGRSFADYFETVVDACKDAKQAANWVTQDVLRELNARATAIEHFPISAEVLGGLLAKIVRGEITVKSAREIFAALMEQRDNEPASAAAIDKLIADRGLAIVSDTSQLDGAISTVLAKNARAVEDFRGGKENAIGALIGQVMREVKGADAKVVRQMLIERLRS